MTKVVVDAGICGFSTAIEVVRLSARRVRIIITSDCEMVSKIGEQSKELDWQNILSQREGSLLYKSAFQCIRHIACPVPVAIIKAIEVEVGIALPRDVVIRFETTNYR